MVAAAFVAASVGCGGPPKQANASDDFGNGEAPAASKPAGDTPSSDAPPVSDTPPSAPASDAPGGGRLNREQSEQIQVALRRGSTKAVQCPDVVPNAPSGDAEVKVTFDGKKGRSVDASVGPPFAGTPIEACIKRAYLDEIIVPFEGAPLDMTTHVKIAGKAAPPDTKGKKH
jgi:hypothetical protein